MKKIIQIAVILLLFISCKKENKQQVAEKSFLKEKKQQQGDCFIQAKFNNSVLKKKNLDCHYEPACQIINNPGNNIPLIGIACVIDDESVMLNLQSPFEVGTYSTINKDKLNCSNGKKDKEVIFNGGWQIPNTAVVLTISKIENGFVEGTFSGILIKNKTLYPNNTETITISEGKFKTKFTKM